MSQETKNCPMCGESIAAAAQKCKHCGEYLDGRQQAASPSPSTVKPIDSVIPPDGRPRLWSPVAVANLSLLFSPIFGCILMAKNWKTLGNEKEAKKAWYWLAGCAAAFVVALMAGEAGASYVVVIVWYLLYAKRQVKYVKETLKNNYIKKPWVVPVIGGIALFAVIFLLAIASDESRIEVETQNFLNQQIEAAGGADRFSCTDVTITEDLGDGVYRVVITCNDGSKGEKIIKDTEKGIVILE